VNELPQNVKGMNDVLPPDVAKWQFVEEKARTMLDAFAYRELRTPILEYTPLFTRSVGEATEVVEKQMYTFDDRDGSSVSMRPEGTASAVRAYIARSQWNREPITRWYYMGPMFRHERAQRGRLRQFHQIGAEVFGLPGPAIDAEMIAMLVALLADLGIKTRRHRGRGQQLGLARRAHRLPRNPAHLLRRPRRQAGRVLAQAPRHQPAAHSRFQGSRRAGAGRERPDPARRARRRLQAALRGRARPPRLAWRRKQP
jgi:hypothetical protein